MDTILLVRYGEIMLKGLNRPVFEKKLVDNIKNAVSDIGEYKIIKSQGRIFIEPAEKQDDMQKLIRRVCKVFGVVSVSPAYRTEIDPDNVFETALLAANEAAKDVIKSDGKKTFKVEARRQDKSYPMDSPEICKRAGAYILDRSSDLKVDVHNPDFVINIEVRSQAYIYAKTIQGFGGMPVGSGGKAMLLLSGGIDSPVAGWMMAKRGLDIEAVHFYSYPYTSERSKDKVIELTRILAEYCNTIRLHVVPFTEIQLAVNEHCSIGLITVIMRRAMMKIAQAIANKTDALALVTGESVGQVASQTIEALNVTNAAVTLPVFRPLIGMDKIEVIRLAEKIGTYETSVLPYEDCCTVFVAKHPVTKPKLDVVEKQENRIALGALMNDAMAQTETIVIQGARR